MSPRGARVRRRAGAGRLGARRLVVVAALAVSTPNLASAPAATPTEPAATAPVAETPAATPASSVATPELVDNCDDPSLWSAHPADGVELRVGSEAADHGRCLRFDFAFRGGGGYAVARRTVDLDLPNDYAFSFRIRGAAPTNHLEFKLVDASGDNVWWFVRRDFRFPTEWQTLVTKKRQIQFAWGPQGGGEIRHVAAIELAITAGSGGEGTVWIDDLRLRELPPASTASPLVHASSESPGGAARLATDGDLATAWSPARRDGAPWISLDFQGRREYGGLMLEWQPGQYAADYDVEASDDGVTWRRLRAVRGANGGRDWLDLHESESSRLQIRILRIAGGKGVALGELVPEPLEWAATPAAFFGAVARDSPRGSYPRGIRGEQPYWAVVAVQGETRSGLLGEDGALEVRRGGFSIEPFLFQDERLWTWSDGTSEQRLEEGSLPIPTVLRRCGELELRVTAFGTGVPGAAGLVARYVVANRGSQRLRGRLFLAIRPFQVNPPSQSLNLQGGVAPIRSIAARGRTARVDDEQDVVALMLPSGFGATSFDAGDVVADHLRTGHLPTARSVVDSTGAASAAFAFSFDLAPGSDYEADVLVPFDPGFVLPSADSDKAAHAWVANALERCRGAWRERLRRVSVQVPDSAVTRSLKAQLGWSLADRAGPAIQPGTRSYARAWIRDGALSSAALLRLGQADVVRDFIEWYAPHQYASGKIPCVVDSRGADPTPEHDSSGEFVFLVAEYLRLTGDRALAEQMWPRVRAAATFLDSLRHERRGAEWRRRENLVFYGLLPPSISHEGYSAKPMHSYWDDLWALRGFRDAAFLAGKLGHDADRRRLTTMGDEFGRDLRASVVAVLARHRIDYVPGCADLGDFDATSTTIALSPVQAERVLPRAALERTFEKYWEFFRDRKGGAAWDAFTPYEIRNVGAFVRLGWRERAVELLDFFLAWQRPPGWRQWPEVVWRDERTPHFLGDLPHGWVASDYVRSVLEMLAYERESDGALVLGAGIPATWLEGPGVRVQGLVTRWGALGFTMRAIGDSIVVQVEPGLRVPPGGIVLRPPLHGPLARASIDGRPIRPAPGGDIVLRRVPAGIVLRQAALRN